MKINKTYRSLLDKSIINVMQLRFTINPNFSYREETFCFAVNAWELILKAYLLKKCLQMENLYVMEPVLKLNG
jgi:hypothetical protein